MEAGARSVRAESECEVPKEKGSKASTTLHLYLDEENTLLVNAILARVKVRLSRVDVVKACLELMGPKLLERPELLVYGLDAPGPGPGPGPGPEPEESGSDDGEGPSSDRPSPKPRGRSRAG